MQELTKQWNWPITRKFEFDYTDFQPEGSRRSIIDLVTVQKRTAIFYAQIKNSIAFGGGGASAVNLYLADIEAITPITNLSAAFIMCHVDFPVDPTHGVGGAIIPRALPSHPTSQCIILNHDQGADLFLVLETDAGHDIDDLTQGAGTVWFSYIRLR